MTTVNCRPNSEVDISPVDHAGKSMLYLLYGICYTDHFPLGLFSGRLRQVLRLLF